MKEYRIRITGSGTLKELSKALIALGEEIEIHGDTDSIILNGYAEWEDPILFTILWELY